MSERFDEADQITNAEVWIAFKYAEGQWDLWRTHVSRKYNIQPTDNYTSAGLIVRGTNTLPENVTPIPNAIKDAWDGDLNKSTQKGEGRRWMVGSLLDKTVCYSAPFVYGSKDTNSGGL